MTERLHHELDAAIESIVRGASEVGIRRDLEPLVSIAAELYGLPRRDFRARLLASLKGETMILDVVPYLVVADADRLIAFVRDVFGAEEIYRAAAPGGGVHCEVMLRGRKVMIGGSSGTAAPASLHVFVDDTDAIYARAIAAGATALHAPVDQEYGLREASVQDAFGNQWYIASDLHTGEYWTGLPPVMPYLHPTGASRLVEFLRDGLGAEVLQRFEEGGVVVHAQLRLGAAVVEMGEAHGAYPAMPAHLYVSVSNADAAYAEALSAGGSSASEPADAPYGRVGAVDDPTGNRWYFVQAIA